MNPYGVVYECPPFGHDNVAQMILGDEFPIEKTKEWLDRAEELGFYVSYEETLQRRGWVRFSTTINRWSCEHCIDFEDHYPRPTRAQIDRMWELTGFNYDDPNSWSQF